MQIKKLGLVLEGGGMRGLYTVGVLDELAQKGLMPDYLIGVSAGACNGISYLSRQEGRGYRVIMNYLKDKRYVGFKNWIKTKSMFGMDFIFDEIPKKLDPFDYDTFLSNPCAFVVGVTDVATGSPVYFDKTAFDHTSVILRASSSIPLFSPMVAYQGGLYLDGGTSDPIPARKAIEDGCDQVIIVLTRHLGYVKKPEKYHAVYHALFRKYPQMSALLDRRHQIYNEQVAYALELEKQGKALLLAPSQPITISRFEKDPQRLEHIYQLGRQDAAAHAARIDELFTAKANNRC